MQDSVFGVDLWEVERQLIFFVYVGLKFLIFGMDKTFVRSAFYVSIRTSLLQDFLGVRFA